MICYDVIKMLLVYFACAVICIFDRYAMCITPQFIKTFSNLFDDNNDGHLRPDQKAMLFTSMVAQPESLMLKVYDNIDAVAVLITSIGFYNCQVCKNLDAMIPKDFQEYNTNSILVRQLSSFP